MDHCLQNGTVLADSGYLFGPFSDAYSKNVPCGASTYLRPNVGGAMIPWLYTVFVIIIHAPVLWERTFNDWEKVVAISLWLAFFNILVTALAYGSTGFDPKQVLVWMPLTLMLDVGSMLQQVVLILEKDKGWREVSSTVYGMLPVWVKPKPKPGIDTAIPLVTVPNRGNNQNPESGSDSEAAQITHPDLEVPANPGPSSECTADLNSNCQATPNPDPEPEKRKRAVYVIIALAMVFMMIALQAIGIGFLVKGQRIDNLQAPFCSPFFESQSVAVMDEGNRNSTTNCPTFYSIAIDSTKGIGCIELDANLQRDWILAALIILPWSMVFETIDLGMLLFASGGWDTFRVKDLRRPWLTVSSLP
jgi:hypothetical protein